MSEAKSLAVVPTPDRAGALALAETIWTPERIELLRRMKMPKAATADEFAIFLAQCQRTGLDPLIDEADCVERRSKRSWQDARGVWHDEWDVKHVFQPREAGMRARADRFPDYRGIAYGVVREGDRFLLNPSKKTVDHEFNPADPERAKKPIVGAWAQITRAGRECAPIWVRFSERVQTRTDKRTGATTATSFWGSKEETMIAKCARAEAFRIEYPNAFAGTFIAEEMEPEEKEINPPPSSAPPPASKTEAVLAQVEARVQSLAPGVQVSEAVVVEKPAAEVVPLRPEPAPAPPPAEAKKPEPKPSPPRTDKAGDLLVPFGRRKGARVGEVSTQEIQEAIAEAEAKLNASPLAPWSAKVRAGIDDLQAEIQDRLAAAIPPNEEEPPF